MQTVIVWLALHNNSTIAHWRDDTICAKRCIVVLIDGSRHSHSYDECENKCIKHSMLSSNQPQWEFKANPPTPILLRSTSSCPVKSVSSFGVHYMKHASFVFIQTTGLWINRLNALYCMTSLSYHRYPIIHRLTTDIAQYFPLVLYTLRNGDSPEAEQL